MTCIVGIADGGKVYIGADSAGFSDNDLTVRKDAKVFRVGAFVIGFTTSFRMGQLLRYSFDPPRPEIGACVERYMNTSFVDAVRKTFREGGFLTVKDSAESGGTFLVGLRGRLFMVAADFQVAESQHGFDAVGCGFPFALGSLHETVGNFDPPERVARSLRTAEKCSGGVRGPFTVVSA